jgi:hypothetical protein
MNHLIVFVEAASKSTQHTLHFQLNVETSCLLSRQLLVEDRDKLLSGFCNLKVVEGCQLALSTCNNTRLARYTN